MVRAWLAFPFWFAMLVGGCCLPLPFDIDGDDEPRPVSPQEIGGERREPSVVEAPPASPPPTPDPEPAPPPQPEISEAQLRARKASEYARHCLNVFSASAYNARGRYLQWVDPEKGPTGRERSIYGVYTLRGDAPKCREAATKAASMPPSLPEVDRAAEAYVNAVEQLQPLLERADRYYDRGSHRDDGMAQGREMHAPLMAAFDAFIAADRELRSFVDDAQDRARKERLAALADDPSKRTQFLIERSLDQALTVVRLADGLRLENGRYVADDPEAFIAAVETARAGIDELLGHEADTRGRGPSFNSQFYWYKNAADDFCQILSRVHASCA